MASLADLDPLAALGIVGDRPPPGTLGYEELKRRQAIAAAMASAKRREFPKTFGEGLTSLGEAVGERMNDDRISKMAAAQRGAEGGVIKGAPGTLAPAVGGGLAVPPVQTAPAPVAAAPAPVAAPVAAPATFDGKPYTEVPVRKSESEELKERLAALLTPTAGEVPQENPTEAEALPPQEAGGPTQPNVQLAALGGTGGTLTDAPQPGAFRLPVSDEPEPTPTDIAPMPVRTAQMSGIPSSGVMPGATSPMSGSFTAMGPNVPPMPADPRAGAPPPDAPPSKQPIPAETTEEPPKVRPMPKQPDIAGPTKAMEYWSRYMNNPNVSPELRAHAQKVYDTDAGYVKELQQRRDANFVHDRQQREAEELRLETWKREAPVRHIDQRIKRLQIEEAIAKAENRPLDVMKLRNEIAIQNSNLEEARYKITQRPMEERGKRATVEGAERTASEPKTLDVAGSRMVAPYLGPGQYGPYTQAPGAPAPEEKALTEKQTLAVQFVLRTREDLDTLRRDDGAELTSMVEGAKSWVPFGSNLLHSEAYRKARNAVDNWGAGFMSLVSGAAITPSEAQRQLPAFVPAPGDDPNELKEKTRRRQQFTDAVAAGGGENAMKAILKESNDYLYDKASRKPAVSVGSLEELKKLDPGQHVILPDGKPGRVPRRPIP